MSLGSPGPQGLQPAPAWGLRGSRTTQRQAAALDLGSERPRSGGGVSVSRRDSASSADLGLEGRRALTADQRRKEGDTPETPSCGHHPFSTSHSIVGFFQGWPSRSWGW